MYVKFYNAQSLQYYLQYFYFYLVTVLVITVFLFNIFLCYLKLYAYLISTFKI